MLFCSFNKPCPEEIDPINLLVLKSSYWKSWDEIAKRCSMCTSLFTGPLASWSRTNQRVALRLDTEGDIRAVGSGTTPSTRKARYRFWQNKNNGTYVSLSLSLSWIHVCRYIEVCTYHIYIYTKHACVYIYICVLYIYISFKKSSILDVFNPFLDIFVYLQPSRPAPNVQVQSPPMVALVVAVVSYEIF